MDELQPAHARTRIPFEAPGQPEELDRGNPMLPSAPGCGSIEAAAPIRASSLDELVPRSRNVAEGARFDHATVLYAIRRRPIRADHGRDPKVCVTPRRGSAIAASAQRRSARTVRMPELVRQHPAPVAAPVEREADSSPWRRHARKWYGARRCQADVTTVTRRASPSASTSGSDRVAFSAVSRPATSSTGARRRPPTPLASARPPRARRSRCAGEDRGERRRGGGRSTPRGARARATRGRSGARR